MLVVRLRLKDSAVFGAMTVSLKDGVELDTDHPMPNNFYVRVDEMNCECLYGTVLDKHAEEYTETNERGHQIPCRAMIDAETVQEAVEQDAISGLRYADDHDLHFAPTLVDHQERLWRSRLKDKDWLS